MKRIFILSLVLALIALLVPVAAFAATTDTTTAQGNVPTSMSLSVEKPSGGIDFFAFGMGRNPSTGWANSNPDGYVYFNPGIDTNASWTLTASSSGSYITGQMWSESLNRFLVDPMIVSLDSGSTYGDLPTGATLTGNASPSTVFTVSGVQQIELADAQAGAGSYSITIDLSVSPMY